MPYRIDISSSSDDVFERLVDLGALDVERSDCGTSAILPDTVSPDAVAHSLGVTDLALLPAVSRDGGSVWLLNPRAVHVGRVLVVPSESHAPPGALRWTDSTAFGTGHHPTTALCGEAIEEAIAVATPGSILDVGTGSGVLALSALMMGVPRAVGLDIDADALRVAAEHARLNGLANRLQLVHGGPEAVDGTWPLVVANVIAASLVEMAPVLVRRVGHRGRLILSGIRESLESEVTQSYQRLGMHHLRSATRGGWSVVVVQASW
ncbi:MAG TPA: 50S ribosomal protein L11 methyltransferase [Terriglobia bacterium]|nr:50S ribosomal protein L11 methyltransferase [Terriglobia bacterium]